MDRFMSLPFWGYALQNCISQSNSGYAADLLRDHDLGTCDGVLGLARFAVSELTNNRVPTTEDAAHLWQISQCLKKFRYGEPLSPEGMMAGWIDRNEGCAAPLECPQWVLWEAKRLLAPLGPAYDAVDSDGRFGNGAVFEGISTLARWNAMEHFSYNPFAPDDVRDWSQSPYDSCRLCCVPKDMSKLRSITVEPSEATFLQQRTRSRLLLACERVMPLSSAIKQQAWGGGPEMQRSRALLASQTGELATIDLSDASDSVRYDVVCEIFPANIVADLERSRSVYCEVNGTRHRIHMFAGMGNATTFVVESLYFWSLITALTRWLRDFVPVSVFGDDIVMSCKSANHPLFQQYLASLGIKLNKDKSGLSESPGFREACGLTAYRGVELPLLRIPGWRIKNPESLVSMCGWITAALDPVSRYAPFMHQLGVMAGKQLRELTRVPVVPVPLMEPGCYLYDPGDELGGWSYRTRWNSDLQLPEIRCRVLRPIYKRIRSRDVTYWEAQGILHGQVRTAFHDAPLGYRSPKTELRVPTGTSEFCAKWNLAPTSDAMVVELGSLS